LRPLLQVWQRYPRVKEVGNRVGQPGHRIVKLQQTDQ
jgi:hypothetical protein